MVTLIYKRHEIDVSRPVLVTPETPPTALTGEPRYLQKPFVVVTAICMKGWGPE